MAKSLPYDILGHIIDILAAEGDLTPVKNISLTSSLLLHFCRTHIFHTISAITKKPLISLLGSNPAIAQYIRKLDYSVYHDDNKLSPLLPNLLQTISLLECLKIAGSLGFKWTKIDPLIRSTILYLMHLPTLTHLVIQGMEKIPISALAPCINLEQLEILYVALAPFEDQSSPSLRMSRSQTPRILRFRNLKSEKAVERLLRTKGKDGHPVLDFANVKTLVLQLEMFQDVRLTPLTRELFENISCLEEIEIDAQGVDNTGSIAGISEMISAHARNLRTLQVTTSLKGSSGRILMGPCEELKLLAGNGVLQVQVLKFKIYLNSLESKAEVENGFRRLEEVLMDPGWSALVCVSIDIFVNRRYKQFAAELELNSVPERYLGRLLSRGILSYKWKDLQY